MAGIRPVGAHDGVRDHRGRRRGRVSAVRWNHLAITVADQERSRRFYASLLGGDCRVRDDPDGMLLTTTDGFVLALLRGEPPRDRHLVHFGFGLDSAEEVRTLRGSLRAEGVNEKEWYDLENFVSMKFLDPDGYVVEVFWEEAQ
jgi:catechol 2,3-dioxygenase-like lactoylglutathione lyase family enzyme